MRTDSLADFVANVLAVFMGIIMLRFSIWFTRNQNPSAWPTIWMASILMVIVVVGLIIRLVGLL